MATKKLIKGDVSEAFPEEDENVADPFAIDFFSQSKIETEENDDFEESFVEADSDNDNLSIEIKRAWNAELPQVSSAEISQALVFSRLPANLAKTVCEIYVRTISQIVLQTVGEVGCEILTTFETNFFDEVENLSREQAISLSFAVEPAQTQAALILDSIFAINIIETALSSDVFANERRELSRTELAVLEFLALSCLKEINDSFTEPLFRWRTIEQSESNLSLSRGLLSQIRIQIGESKGIVKLLLPFEFLQNISESKNQLLARQSNHRNENIARVSQLVASTHLRSILGETTVDAAELAVLERGDVILIERQFVKFSKSILTGSIPVRIADETAASVTGELIASSNLKLRVKEINQKDETKFTKFMMPDNQSQTLSEDKIDNEERVEDGLALEKVVVNVAVELVSRRINLDEIASLRVGQIVELGSRATDPVELVASGRTIAIGELIDVEGSLGVRLTRVLL